MNHHSNMSDCVCFKGQNGTPWGGGSGAFATPPRGLMMTKQNMWFPKNGWLQNHPKRFFFLRKGLCFGLPHNRKPPNVDSKNEKNTCATKTDQQHCWQLSCHFFWSQTWPRKVYECPEWGKSSEDLEEGEASPVDLPDAASTKPMEWTWDMPLQDGFRVPWVVLSGACGLVVASVCVPWSASMCWERRSDGTHAKCSCRGSEICCRRPNSFRKLVETALVLQFGHCTSWPGHFSSDPHYIQIFGHSASSIARHILPSSTRSLRNSRMNCGDIGRSCRKQRSELLQEFMKTNRSLEVSGLSQLGHDEHWYVFFPRLKIL